MADLTLPNNPFAPPTPGLPDPPVVDPAIAARMAMTHTPGDTAPPTFGDMAAVASQLPAATPSAVPSGIPATGALGGPAPPLAPPPLVQGVDPTLSFRQPVPVVGGGGGYGALPNNDKAIAAAGNAEGDALKQQGAATAASDAAEAAARQQGAEQVAAQQKDLQAQRVQRDQFFRQVNQESADALEKAHNTTVPDFWEGKEGQLVTSAILVGLGAVGQSLTAFGTGVNIGNGAQQTINHAVDSYYDRKKDEVNNLYRYAAAKGQLNDQAKLDYATKLNDLQFDLAATHQSIQDHLAEVAAQGRGAIDQAHFASLAAENEQRTQQLQQSAAMNRAQIVHMRNEDRVAGANAESERIKALASGQKVSDTEGKTAVFAPDKNPDGSQRLLGYVTSGRGGAQKFSEADAAFTNAKSALTKLDADIEQNGARVFTPEAVKRRDFLKKNANIAVGAVSSLGNTDSAHDQEFASIGSSGAGLSLYGANREAISAKIAELGDRQERARTQGLIERPGAGRPTPGQFPAAAPTSDMVTIRNGKTGETKTVSRAEAQQMGAL